METDKPGKEEPASLKFPKAKIRFFNSSDEQREEMYVYWASISPEQRLIHLKEMVIASYGLTQEKRANPGLINKITFINNHKGRNR